MTDRYVRLEEAPGLSHPGYPICDACHLETRWDDQAWICEGCGTAWPDDDMEHPPENAMMYEEWSGVELTGPVCPNDYAWLVAKLPPDERQSRIEEYLR